MNLSMYLSYVFLGITLAAPIGPVNSARLDKGLKNGFWHAWIVGAGSMIADAIFMLLVYLGLVNFLEYEPVKVFLWLFGGFILIYSGIESIFQTNKIDLNLTRTKDSLFKCFITGFLMSISSPLSILFWLGIYGSVLADSANTYGAKDLFLFSSMIFVGLTTWDIFVALLTSGFRKFLNQRLIKTIAVLSGLSLVGFGLYFGYEGIMTLLF